MTTGCRFGPRVGKNAFLSLLGIRVPNMSGQVCFRHFTEWWSELNSIALSVVAVAIAAASGEAALAQIIAAGCTATGKAVPRSGSRVSRIAIPFPPRVDGFEPKVFFKHSGQVENVGLGPGWSIGRYPRIPLG